MLRRLGAPDRLGGVLFGLCESAELGEAQASQQRSLIAGGALAPRFA
jgi:hypothetical protein